MITRKILTSRHKEYIIQNDDYKVIEWFEDPSNHTELILNQINTERMYDQFFKDRTDMVVIDLGANSGLFSLYAHDSCSLVIAVEPIYKTYKVLEELTKDIPQIVIEKSVISNTDDKVSFYINHNSTVHSMINRGGPGIKLQGITFKSLLEKYNLDKVDFVKCDIEGSEILVITEETLRPVADKISAWFIEVHETNHEHEYIHGKRGTFDINRNGLAKIFESCGYTTRSEGIDQLFAWK
jgi:FkbM family methyltransferase